ncbi:MAG: hypothetical protein K9N07_00460 [Candidatus Cloacimonetes bacterium]|nr:hypothetical protein [Candidatus Cloacimonadota bacterium]
MTCQFFHISNLRAVTHKYEIVKYQEVILVAEAKDTTAVSKLIVQLNKEVQTFQKKVGVYLDIPVRIVIAPNQKVYQRWTKEHSAIMEFSSGFYMRINQTIYLKNPHELKSLSNISTILLHEYIHHFVSSFWKSPPLWFNEGMAVYFSNDMGIDRELNFAKNYIMGNSRTLTEMTQNYPKNMIEWESFYAKSGLAVKYLFLKKRELFYRLWEKSRTTGNFEMAFLNSFFMTTKTFSEQFEEYSKSHFKSTILLASTSLIWGFLPLILILGVIRKKINNKKTVETWQQEQEINTQKIHMINSQKTKREDERV